MERIIKFRAWDKSDKKMMSDVQQGINLYCSSTCKEEPLFDFGEIINLNHAYELMQFTGLLDKNGKEIYEGDIVKNNWHNTNGKDIGNNWIVKYGEYDNSDTEYGSGGHIGFYVEAINGCEKGQEEGLHNLPTDRDEEIEVIGNIYANPELLEAK